LLDLQQSLNLTMLFISHDLSVVRVLCDRVAVMFAGRILELADASALFKNPLQPYTQELLAAIPIPDPTRAKRAKSTWVRKDTDSVPVANGTTVSTPSDVKTATTAAQQANGCPYAGRCPQTMDICWQQMPAFIDYAPRLGEEKPHFAACHWVEQNVGK
jgi:oligopeptide/dipeptide ABC transporter ATP-binding protein